MITTPTASIGSLFSGADLCDRCSARAVVIALLHSGGQLLFCGHHARLHRAALDGIADIYYDRSGGSQLAVA